MKKIILSSVFSALGFTMCYAQDTYWALLNNKRFNTATGKVTDNRSNEFPIELPELAYSEPRGLFDAAGYCLFTFDRRYTYTNNVQLGPLNDGGIAAFPVNKGTCRQYLLVNAYRASNAHAIMLQDVDASSSTGTNIDAATPTLGNKTTVYTTIFGQNQFQAIVAPAPGGEHYLYQLEVTTSGNGYTYIQRHTIHADGSLDPNIYTVNNNGTLPVLNGKARISQDGTVIAYQDDNNDLQFVDAVTGTLINSIGGIGATIWGLEEDGMGTMHRWYYATNNGIQSVLEDGSGSITISTAATKSDLSLGRDGNIYFAAGNPAPPGAQQSANPGDLYYFVPGTSGVTAVANGAGVVYSNGLFYSFGNMVTGENTSITDGYDIYGDYTISGNTAWDPSNNPAAAYYGVPTNVIRIKGDLKVATGADAELRNMTVEMAPENQVVIAPAIEDVGWAGYLTLNNTILTVNKSSCSDGSYWQGVRISGAGNDYAQTYLFSHPHSSYHATLNMTNHSSIQHASWGIITSGPNQLGGGILLAENSSFVNNRRSIAYAPYHYNDQITPGVYHPYRSRLTDCDFILNTSGNAQDFLEFVTGSDVDGVTFNGCHFLNQSLKINYVGYECSGILGHNFGFVIEQSDKRRSLFEDLNYGISAGSLTSTFPLLDVRHTDFRNVRRGIRVSAVDRFTVANSTFDIPSNVPDESFGIDIEGDSYYTIRDNTFAGNVGNFSAGIRFNNTGGNTNIVHSNIFQGLYYGNQVWGINKGNSTGLEFRCNQFAGNENDIWINPKKINGVNNNIAAQQGSPEIAAGNTFNGSTCNFGGSLDPADAVTYYYYQGNAAENPPSICANNVYKTSTNLQNACTYLSLPAVYTDEPNYGIGAKGVDGSETSRLEGAAIAEGNSATGETAINAKGISKSGLFVYPNPAHNMLFVNHSSAGTFHLADITGKILVRQSLNESEQRTGIDIHQLTPGTYLYTITTEGQPSVRGKVTVQ